MGIATPTVPDYNQIQAAVQAANPIYTKSGQLDTNPADYSLGMLTDVIAKAEQAGRTPAQIIQGMNSIIGSSGWVHGIGEYSDTDLMGKLGMIPGQPGYTPPTAPYVSTAPQGPKAADVYSAAIAAGDTPAQAGAAVTASQNGSAPATPAPVPAPALGSTSPTTPMSSTPSAPPVAGPGWTTGFN